MRGGRIDSLRENCSALACTDLKFAGLKAPSRRCGRKGRVQLLCYHHLILLRSTTSFALRPHVALCFLRVIARIRNDFHCRSRGGRNVCRRDRICDVLLPVAHSTFAVIYVRSSLRTTTLTARIDCAAPRASTKEGIQTRPAASTFRAHMNARVCACTGVCVCARACAFLRI